MYLRALQDITNSTETTNPLADEDSIDFSYEFSFVSSLVATVFLLLCLREFYVRRYGVDFCPVFHLFPSSSSHQQSQVDRDRAYAEEVQRQLDLENHEAELEAKRKERREWYESFIVPYTMTVEESDFFYAQETDENGNTILEGKLTPSSRKYSSISSEDLEEELVGEVQQQQSDVEYDEEGVVDDDGDSSSMLYLRLPVRDDEGHCRSVEATCTICFSEYEQGDRVVWSELRCKHAFHYDCILPWLVKGKKRCPICRDWFVPGARIEDQKKALAERLARENTMSTTTTDGSDNTDEQEGECENSLDVQGSSDSEAVSSATDDCCVVNGDGSCMEHPECKRNGCRCADLENQHKLNKQLSSSEDDDEATSSGFLFAETETSSTDSARRIACDESAEAVPANLECSYPVTTTTSLTARDSNLLTMLDDELLQAHGNPRVEQNESSSFQQTDDSIPDDISTSRINETQEISA